MTTDIIDNAAEIEALYVKMQELNAEAGALYASINAATNNVPDTEVEELNIKADAIHNEAEKAYASYMKAFNDINS